MHSGNGMESASHPGSESRNLFSCFDHYAFQHGSDLHIQSRRKPKSCIPITLPDVQLHQCDSQIHVIEFFHSLDYLSRSAISAFPSGAHNKVKWSETRKMALARDGYRCRYPDCGRTDPLTVHHIHPRGLGGGHHLSNLVTLCESCHQNLCAQCLRPAYLRVPLGDAAMKFPGIFA